jgi:hypothetical protein
MIRVVSMGGMYSLSQTGNQSTIKAVLASNDEFAKSYLADNPHLSHSEVKALSEGGVMVRKAVAMSPHVPLDILGVLLADADEDVRFHALRHPRTSVDDFNTAIMTGKLSASTKKALAYNVKAAATLEVFDRLWSMKAARANLISAVDSAVYDSAPVDSRVFDIIHDFMKSGEAPNSMREAYASVRYADPEILDSWKTDSHRPVINAIAGNGAAWVSTHEHLVDNHKTPSLRISIARVTKDKDLLSKIYYGTKNNDIRESVMKNPLFIA